MRSRSILSPPFILAFFTMLLCYVPHSYAASFACGKASTVQEKAVCATPELSAMDRKLDASYRKELRALSPESAALVRSDQREWLRFLDKACPQSAKKSRSVADCLSEQYTVRLGQFSRSVHQVNGMLFFTRSHIVFKPGAPPAKGERRAMMDPGFGYGEFSWLQIDRPSPAQQAWNGAAYQAAVSAQAASPNGGGAGFEASIDGSGSLYGLAHLIAANQTLIDIEFETEMYEWGQVHPTAAKSSFLWLLTLGRPVTVHDVFEPSSQWQARVVPPALAVLHKERDAHALFAGDELNKGVAEGVAQIANWGLSSQGLTITFAQYQVGPYYSGMPTVTLPWSELKPLLNDDLHTNELPPRLPDAD